MAVGELAMVVLQLTLGILGLAACAWGLICLDVDAVDALYAVAETEAPDETGEVIDLRDTQPQADPVPALRRPVPLLDAVPA